MGSVSALKVAERVQYLKSTCFGFSPDECVNLTHRYFGQLSSIGEITSNAFA